MRHVLAFFACLAVAVPARAESSRVVSGLRVELGEVVDGLPEELRDLDLGPAPPPGGSRLLDRREIERRLVAAGVSDRQPPLPELVRLSSLTRSFDKPLIEKTALGLAAADLGERARALRVSGGRPLVTYSDAVPLGLSVPRLPRRPGRARLAVVLELGVDGVVVERLPLTLDVEVAEGADKPALVRGTEIEVSIERGGVRIGARASLLKDADVGEVVQAQILATRRIVKVRLESAERGTMVER